ncbi:MAG: pyruvate, phosphate dikinase [Pseudomonadota bacterium]
MTVEIGWIGPDAAPLEEDIFGTKAALLSRACRTGVPVPPAFVVPANAIRGGSDCAIIRPALERLQQDTGRVLGDPDRPLLLSVRSSTPGQGSDVVPAILNLGAGAGVMAGLRRNHGEQVAEDLRRRLIQSFGVGALGVDEEEFEYALYDLLKEVGAHSEQDLSAEQVARLTELSLSFILDESGHPFPEMPLEQLQIALTSMARGWDAPRSRVRRLARGGDEDGPLSVIVQMMVSGLGADGTSGAGIAHPREHSTGARQLTGRYLDDAQGSEAMMGLRTPVVLTRAERDAAGLREPSLEETNPDAVAGLKKALEVIERELAEVYSVDFTIEAGQLHILELRPMKRSARASVQIVVDLVEAGALGHADALMRIGPAIIDEHLHPTIDPAAPRDPIGQGLPASPGAASAPLVFTPPDAEAAAALGRPAILALIETSPEDISGMHSAIGVLTVRGGMTSHAAVVARGLGKPCVVGAKDLALDRRERVLTAGDGRTFREGDVITVDGGTGQILAGSVPTQAPEITGAFGTLMEWADAERRLGVRANADTARDAETALDFSAQGIGLCRTEHMFFQDHRIGAMRQMILAETPDERQAALDKLLPMQRADFRELFESMRGRPVVIRLLDPPLHEFLPHGTTEMDEIARSLAVPIETVRARSLELAEFNPMLGNRGCRIGIAFPEIYRMQVKAVFEAYCDVAEENGVAPIPEIMIPLVSAVREFDLLKDQVSVMARDVSEQRGQDINYDIGVMIETPRACLRSGDIAKLADFLSFGTNDLTQMLYGLSRDDAGRFIPNYVDQGVFAHDPFHQIDEEGVGEIIRLGIERARTSRPGVSIGLCGEHGGDPDSIDFCHRAGFDYISCSPYRVPIARLAAAQAAIRDRK